MEYVKCEECKYYNNCPCGWSYCNAACLTIQEKSRHYAVFTDTHWLRDVIGWLVPHDIKQTHD